MENTIELEAVSKSFGRFKAVDGLSFTVPKGIVFGLLGPNGAGKTTTIRMIMNITAPDEGQIRVLGSPMSRPTQNRIGYLPEERGLYRKMKVLDHLYFLAAIKEVTKEKAKERIGEWIDKMELRPWLNKKVDELSKGMQQTVNGAYVIALAKGTDRREFLRNAVEHYNVKAFSEKEPELEEIYLSAVRKAGLEETRTIE